jgi:hypothetical protein
VFAERKALRDTVPHFFLDAQSRPCYEVTTTQQQTAVVARDHEAPGGRPVRRSEGHRPVQEPVMSNRIRHHAFGLVFLALFGLLFFVSPAGI